MRPITEMFHRHLTAERYELALEDDPNVAEELRRRASTCRGCEAAIRLGALAPALAGWTPPAAVNEPLDWRGALARAIAPVNHHTRSPRTLPLRLLVATGALLILLLALAVPAAATSGPDSVLFPVRGASDDLRWRTTPLSERAKLEAELTAAYLWEARVSASRKDRAAYRAAMNRVFIWSDRLKGDVTNSPAAERPKIRATVSAGQSLLPALRASGVDEHEAGQVDSVLSNVQGESQQGDGEHSGGG